MDQSVEGYIIIVMNQSVEGYIIMVKSGQNIPVNEYVSLLYASSIKANDGQCLNLVSFSASN